MSDVSVKCAREVKIITKSKRNKKLKANFAFCYFIGNSKKNQCASFMTPFINMKLKVIVNRVKVRPVLIFAGGFVSTSFR